MTPSDLIAFETEIADLFNQGKIRHPVHLSDGNEAQLIEIFKGIDIERDWICGSWRAHYHCLLKGVPPEELKAAIMAGQSMALCFPEYRIVSSAIVGGILPIALGIAMGIKRDGGSERVLCFLGDMTALSGIFHECSQYASWHDLPIRWIIEDNGVSVCTDTRSAWGITKNAKPKRSGYAYKSKYPHAGAGVRVEF
jgi:pyruvate dehydrogenase E1 component alpha subunit